MGAHTVVSQTAWKRCQSSRARRVLCPAGRCSPSWDPAESLPLLGRNDRPRGQTWAAGWPRLHLTAFRGCSCPGAHCPGARGVQPSPAPPHVLLPALCPEAGDGVWPAETQNFSGTTPYSGDPPHRHGVLVTLTNAHKRHGCPFQVSGDQQGLGAAGESRSAAPL